MIANAQKYATEKFKYIIMGDFKNHKWEYEDILKYTNYRGTCKRCGIIRYKCEYGGYEYLDLRTPIGSERMTFTRPLCSIDKTIHDMGIRCHF